jgi:1-carboxybiuret hydrolase subunit AtzG-like protein
LKRDERRIWDDGAMTENDNPLEAYVRAALALQGYAFDEAEIAEIAVQFSRLETIARTVFDWPLPFASEPAPVFRP